MALVLTAKESWFTLLRGRASGRVDSGSLAISGDHVFVLGARDYSEPAFLSDGDNVVLKQTVDLTSVDVVAPSMRTIGVAMANFVTYAKMNKTANTVGLWQMDKDSIHAQNEVVGGPHLFGEGEIQVSAETYSVNGTRCRLIPAGSTEARLAGINNPQMLSSSPTAYTLHFFLDFYADSHDGSTGKDITVFELRNPGQNGLRIHLLGLSGLGVNEYNFAVTHENGGTTETKIIPGYVINANQGFKNFTVVFDVAEVGGSRIKLYEDAVFVGSPATAMSIQPGTPPEDCLLRIAHPDLYGKIDQFHFEDVARSSAEVAANYAAITGPNTEEETQWRMEIAIDGDTYAERVIQDGERRSLSDFRVPVRHLNGSHEVVFRMTYEKVP